MKKRIFGGAAPETLAGGEVSGASLQRFVISGGGVWVRARLLLALVLVATATAEVASPVLVGGRVDGDAQLDRDAAEWPLRGEALVQGGAASVMTCHGASLKNRN
jgi:hypothetical protein